MNDLSFNFDNFDLISRREWQLILRILWQFEWVKIDTYKHYFQQYSYDMFINRLYSMIERLQYQQQNSKYATIYKSVSKQELFDHLKIVYILLTESDEAKRNVLFSKLHLFGGKSVRNKEDDETSKLNGIGRKEFVYVFKSLLNIVDDGSVGGSAAGSGAASSIPSIWDVKWRIIPQKIVSVLQLVLLQVGLFYKLERSMRIIHRCDVNSEYKELTKNLNELIDCYHLYYDLIPFGYVNLTQKSIYHLCIIYNIGTFFGLNIVIICGRYFYPCTIAPYFYFVSTCVCLFNNIVLLGGPGAGQEQVGTPVATIQVGSIGLGFEKVVAVAVVIKIMLVCLLLLEYMFASRFGVVLQTIIGLFAAECAVVLTVFGDVIDCGVKYKFAAKWAVHLPIRYAILTVGIGIYFIMVFKIMYFVIPFYH